MISSAKQLKAKIKNMTEGLSPFEKSEKSQMLIRLFLMEGFDWEEKEVRQQMLG